MYKYLDVTEFVQVLIMKSKTRFISSSNVEKKHTNDRDKLFCTAIVEKFHNFDKDDNDKNLCFGS